MVALGAASVAGMFATNTLASHDCRTRPIALALGRDQDLSITMPARTACTIVLRIGEASIRELSIDTPPRFGAVRARGRTGVIYHPNGKFMGEETVLILGPRPLGFGGGDFGHSHQGNDQVALDLSDCPPRSQPKRDWRWISHRTQTWARRYDWIASEWSPRISPLRDAVIWHLENHAASTVCGSPIGSIPAPARASAPERAGPMRQVTGRCHVTVINCRLYDKRTQEGRSPCKLRSTMRAQSPRSS